MIRFICIVIFVVLFLIVTAPVRLAEWLLHRKSPRAADISSLRIVQWAFRFILRITGVKTTVIGEENIPDEAVLFVVNHGATLTSCSHTADAGAPPDTWPKGDGEISRPGFLDAPSPLSLPGPEGSEGRIKNDPAGH